MFLNKIQQKIDNWFTITWFLSKTWVLLIFAGMVLTIISYSKWIQILMFIPAFVLAIFTYSFFDIYLLKRSLKVKFLKVNWKTYLQIIWKKKTYDSLFRLAFDDWEKVKFLTPNESLIFNEEEIEWKYFLVVQWKIDIFRHIIKLKNLDSLGKLDSKWRWFDKNIYFFSRLMENWEWVDRIDHLRTAKSNDIFLKQNFTDDFKAEEDKSLWKSWINIFSKSKPFLIKDIKKWEYLEWLMILVWIIVIFLEWGNISFLFLSWFSSFFIFIMTVIFEKRINSMFLMRLSFFIIFAYFFFDWKTNTDWIAAWAHFLLMAAIIKHLFKKEFRDSFTYIFLILFVFVALSLLALKSWFIIFFGLFMFLTVNLFITYSWWDLKYEFSRYFCINKTWKNELLFSYFAIFLLTIFLFFTLPHWEKEKQDMSMFRAQESEDLKTWFDDKVSLDNIRELKNDYSKVFVVENAKKEKIPEYSTTYWRWMRFLHFKDYSWNKIPQRDSYLINNFSKWKKYEEWVIKYYLDASKNIFVPKTPLQISDGNIVQYWFDNTIFYYEKPQFASRTINFKFEENNWRIVEKNAELEFLNVSVDKKVKELLQKYWNTIPEWDKKTAWKLSRYIREKSWFTYSIEKPAKNLDSFLYNEKQWHCEYYATLLTLTLQHFWYDATFVNWFHWWEWNDLAKVWVVRWADAHSWVEVLNEDWKWDTYDPTPTARYEWFWFDDIDFAKTLIKYYDLIELKWYNYIVWFTWVEQKKIWTNIFKNYDTILFLSFLILLWILTKNVFQTDILPHFKRSKKERFLWWLKNKTKSDSFVLKNLEKKYPNLVKETREVIFSGDGWDLKKLRKKWSKVIKK